MGLERWLRVLRLRARSLFRRREVERELDDELAYHLERLIDAEVARGSSPAEARRAALAAMDGLERRKEECRDARGTQLVEDLARDMRDGWRQAHRHPGFVLVVTAVLALAIGGNTAVFSVAHVVLAPLPVPNADKVVMVWTEDPARGWHHFPASIPDIQDWRASGIFSSLGAFKEGGFNVRRADRTDRIEGLTVTPGLFEALTMPPMQGRLFTAAETAAGNAVLISDRLWRDLFGHDPGVVGQQIVVDGSSSTIVGVLPAGFPRFGHEDMYVPRRASRADTNRGDKSLNVLGRLRADVSFAAAERRMTEVSRDLANRYPHEDGGSTAKLQPVQKALVQDAEGLLALIGGAVACALAIACANVASLLIARGRARRRELAIRAALGGGRWRLMRQLLTEHLLLAAIAGAIALVPAWWGVRAFAASHLDELPNADLARLDVTALAFNFAVALVTGALCGAVPAWLACRGNAYDALRTTPTVDSGRLHQRLRSFFVMGQIALTVMFLVAGGLMVRSLLRLLSESAGYNPQGLLTMRLALSETQYSSPGRQVAFFERVVERARELPGVIDASAAQGLPPTGDDLHASGLLFPAQPEPRLEDVPLVLNTSVLPGYFHTMQIPLIRGRLITALDTADAPPVALIDEWTAARYWPGLSVIGQRLQLGRTQPSREIVGVVGNVEAPVLVRFLKGRVGQVYLPLAQAPASRLSLVIRGAGDVAALAAPMREIVRGVDPDQPAFKVQTVIDMRSAGQRTLRLVTELLNGFAIAALVLAAIGLYGTIAYDVGQRTREFGLRMSLGAQPWAVMAPVLRQGTVLLAVGGCLGIVAALLATRMLASVLYGVPSTDPIAFASALGLLAAGGLVASYVPARRATKVDPILALRCD
jgi:putative ABC transport system permease protein